MKKRFKESTEARIALYVGLGVLGLVLGIVQSPTPFWGIVLGLCVMIIGFQCEIWMDIKRPSQCIEVIEGEADYEMRDITYISGHELMMKYYTDEALD